jgi:hypothetical protein
MQLFEVIKLFTLLMYIPNQFSSVIHYPLPSFLLELNQTSGFAIDGRAQRRLNQLAELTESDNLSPLFQGMGTHYSFMWVGTPAQRVSVIVDTGSHYTAFPCVGCKCGKHVRTITKYCLNQINFFMILDGSTF